MTIPCCCLPPAVFSFARVPFNLQPVWQKLQYKVDSRAPCNKVWRQRLQQQQQTVSRLQQRTDRLRQNVADLTTYMRHTMAVAAHCANDKSTVQLLQSMADIVCTALTDPSIATAVDAAAAAAQAAAASDSDSPSSASSDDAGASGDEVPAGAHVLDIAGFQGMTLSQAAAAALQHKIQDHSRQQQQHEQWLEQAEHTGQQLDRAGRYMGLMGQLLASLGVIGSDEIRALEQMREIADRALDATGARRLVVSAWLDAYVASLRCVAFV